jgi:hypothetical protein
MEGDVEPKVCVPFATREEERLATRGTKVAKVFFVLLVHFVAKGE